MELIEKIVLFKKTIRCSNTTNLGGPVISLKANPNKDQITVYWASIDSPKTPIECYELLINGEKKEIVSLTNISNLESHFFLFIL
jgi:hypothetical protein